MVIKMLVVLSDYKIDFFATLSDDLVDLISNHPHLLLPFLLDLSYHLIVHLGDIPNLAFQHLPRELLKNLPSRH